MAVRISVIVPTYRPGDGIQRVVDSLDRQTLPADEFEVVLVDDGSPDDTFGRLQGYAASRPNYRVAQIENSGWPSRPRNLGTRMATGEYVLYLDHDDSLYPDALRRLVEYGEQTGADLISPKESKTSDVWWGIPELAAGNEANIKERGAVGRLLPMVPHKAYRREFLLDHQIAFPEGRRLLWEDVYVNIEAYAKADRVAVLADTPVYLWHESGSNNSTSYGATDTEFWDRLDALMAFIDTTLAGPEFDDARRAMLMHQYQGRVLRRLSRSLEQVSEAERAVAMSRARSVQQTFIPPEWDARLGVFGQIRARFLRDNRPDLLIGFQHACAGLSARTTASRVEWQDGVLQVDATSQWHRSGHHTLGLAREGDRVQALLPHQLSEALPADLLDLTDRVHTFSVLVGARARTEYVTWQLPATCTVEVTDGEHDVVLVAHLSTRLDPATAAYDQPLPDTVWDLVTQTRWQGISQASPLYSTIRPLPALIDGRMAVAYTSRSGKLSVDLAHRQRSAVLDAGIRLGPVRRSQAGYVVPLRGIHVSGDTRRSLDVVLNPTAPEAPDTTVGAWLVGDLAGARLEITEPPPRGRHPFAVRTGEATLSSGLFLRMNRGGLLWIVTGTEWLRPGRLRALPGRLVRAARRRLRRSA
ncbi:MAG: glycosyltransferase family 2 protein [Propionicimonas sp.]|nr:glycosyltransferase family 2 protein [Propionicimonas sp.]